MGGIDHGAYAVPIAAFTFFPFANKDLHEQEQNAKYKKEEGFCQGPPSVSLFLPAFRLQ